MPRAEALGCLMGIGLPGSPLVPPDPATGSDLVHHRSMQW
jgi:hypothetical protein